MLRIGQLLAYGTAYQPMLLPHVAGNFQGTANIFVQTVTPLTTITLSPAFVAI